MSDVDLTPDERYAHKPVEIMADTPDGPMYVYEDGTTEVVQTAEGRDELRRRVHGD